ncbi:hypothetical protein HYW55_00070 [Candidatus Gottesmanbacteria bacterium]|nr:hypothetical protein [Candidatus Gottesmanbacteria bacterium]
MIDAPLPVPVKNIDLKPVGLRTIPPEKRTTLPPFDSAAFTASANTIRARLNDLVPGGLKKVYSDLTAAFSKDAKTGGPSDKPSKQPEPLIKPGSRAEQLPPDREVLALQEALTEINPFMDEAGRAAVLQKFLHAMSLPISPAAVKQITSRIHNINLVAGSVITTLGSCVAPLFVGDAVFHAVGGPGQVSRELFGEASKAGVIGLLATAIGSTFAGPAAILGIDKIAPRVATWVVRRDTARQARDGMRAFLSSAEMGGAQSL